MKRSLPVLPLLLLLALPAQAEPLVFGWPASGGDGGWEEREFDGETRYRVLERGGRRVLEAESEAAASCLYLERAIDLAATPVLEWSWRIGGTPAVADERVKDGDDFAARVYVVAPGDGWFAMPIALNYVWASQARVGDAWPNPFTDNVMIWWRWTRATPTPAPGAATGATCATTSAAFSGSRWRRSKASR